ncbi:histone-lysine N-methyltransferase ASHR1 isoform X1 [Iris pallida]|uniref:Histone-lysine N-methyltransferase ASHR1 isoform X1 n=1 Tax=Iris pallida TaxID=29817 RepID=A0AAX6FP39_IRIPA|nr:histone-lysine N-methyltransferase ASHR1 isoform X1 [Iris pallida]
MAADELQGALSAHGLTLSSIPGKGRGLVATRDFAPGDVIIYQEPYASSANKTSGGSTCDGCFVSDNLRKCSACRVAWYCGNMCQKSEWKLHQLECQALAALNEDRKKMLTPTIRLMMRLLLKRKLQQEQAIPTTATDDYKLVDALVSHMSEINEDQLVLYAQMANLVKLVLSSVDVDLKEIAENFSKLACNAHTICDSELRPLGTGLYPVISIINHSCVPNSVLVFEGRVAYVRAMEHVAKGTEVLISYIETAATTKTRQNDLKQYFFICKCSRCIKSPYEELKENAILEGYKCKDYRCNGFLLHDSEKKVFTCQQCGTARDQQETERIASEVAKLSKKASSLWSSGNFPEASTMYKTLEQAQVELCHPYSIDLLRTRDTLLKILMELNDWKGALTYCKLTIPVYRNIYQTNHPMLGLQYYTCGKLEWLLEHTRDALKSFTQAWDILRVTHGTATPFMRDLLSRLEEARAEASYKHPDDYNCIMDD